MNLKLNYIGIVAAILAFVSLALPWWTVSYTQAAISYSMSLYPWGASASLAGFAFGGSWFMYAALAFIILGGILGLAGSAMLTKTGKMLLLVGGILAILAPIIFVVGFMTTAFGPYLWFSGTVGTLSLNTMLSYGFFLAFVAAIIEFVAWFRHSITMPTPPS